MLTVEDLDLEHPEGLYERLRATDGVPAIEGTPIHLVARHADVMEVLARTDEFSNTIQEVLYDVDADLEKAGSADGAAADVLATADPPRHTVHRGLVATAFTNRRIADLAPMVEAMVTRLLAPSLGARFVEWMGTVAIPVPIAVVAHVLDLPTDDLSRLQRWSDAGVDVLGVVTPPERMAECAWIIADWVAYHHARVLEAVDAPDDGSDALTPTIARAVRAGEVSSAEAASLVMQLVAAGSESTSSLMGSAVRILAEQPDLQSDLRDHPERIPTFLEEVLRLEAPFRGHFRRVLVDTELAGTALRAGDRLFVLWSAANRDTEVFELPDQVDLDRDNPRQHLAFGNGLHFCIGAPLARLESRIALEALLGSTRSFKLAGQPRHLPNLMVRRVSALPLVLEV